MHRSTSLNWIDDNREALTEKIRAWSEINSGSRNLPGLARMAGVLETELRAFDATVERLDLPRYAEARDDGETERHSTGQALRAVCRPGAPRTVLLNGHYDTVFGPDHPFQHCAQDKNFLRGPGVADMKGGLVVMLAALHAFERSPDRDVLGWEILLTPDEEIGSPSSAPLLADTAKSGRHCAGLVFEPALPDGRLVSARMGTANFAIVVRGRAAHSGRDFSQGRNAIVKLAEVVPQLHGLNRDAPETIVNVGRITGGGPLNIVPDLATCRVNVRATSAENLKSIATRIHDVATNTARGSDGFSITVRETAGRPPKPLTPQIENLLHALRECGRELGLSLDWAPTGGGSDGNNLVAAGLPTVDTLGVRGGAIHSSDEFLEIDSIPERAKLTALFLQFLARKGCR